MSARKARVLYQHSQEKSRIFRLLFRKLDDLHELCCDLAVVFPLVGAQAVGAVLDALGIVAKIAAAAVAQGVKRAIAEQAAEGLRVRAGVAGVILTFLILEKIIMSHKHPLFFAFFLLIWYNPSKGDMICVF